MSSKKDKFSQKDKLYMELALDLANVRQGLTGNNPSVGCVIVKNDEIISIGQTGFNGRPHAEYNAIKNSYENLKGSKMYITLEPCNHYSLTPPCTNEIIKNNSPFIYIDGLILGTTNKIGKIKVEHVERSHGKSGYTITKMLKLWSNMTTSFSIFKGTKVRRRRMIILFIIIFSLCILKILI